MSDLDKRIRAFSAKPKYVARLTVDDVLAAMAPREKPPAVAKADLREQADAAVAVFRGGITKLPAVDPAARERERQAARELRRSARRRPHTDDGSR